MLSRVFLHGNRPVTKGLGVLYQPSLALTTACNTDQEKPSSGKRDLVNFPDIVRPERPPPTRLGFIPETWFQMFYPKTGVTGPYMLAVSFGTYLFSKEIIVTDHNFSHAVGFIGLLTLINMKFGDKIGAVHDKLVNEEKQMIDAGQEAQKAKVRNTIKEIENKRISEEYVSGILKAKKENVMLQVEGHYRERLNEVYKKVKQMLDYQIELQNVERRIAQRNLADFVIRNVMSSITTELEKSAMQNCINDLNALAAKA